MNPHLSRGLVRVLPFASQVEFAETVGNGASIQAIFEIGESVTDRNQLSTSPAPTGTIVHAVGPSLDVVCFFDGGAATAPLVVDIAIGKGVGVLAPTFMELARVDMGRNTLVNFDSLRITGRYARVTFTNNSGSPALTRLGVYVRSN